MTDTPPTPLRSQSALELLETHAKALEEEIARLRAALETIRQGWETFPWGIIAREALRGAHELYPGEGDNRAVSTEGCRSAATVSGTPESYSCSDPRQDARTPAGDGAPSPVLHAHETAEERK